MEKTLTNITEEEVDEALCEIERKYRSDRLETNQRGCSKSNSNQLLKKLFEEFDCLGISELHDDNHKADKQSQLAFGALKLVNIHRKAIAQLKEDNIALATLKVNNLQLEKKLESCKCEIIQRDGTVEAVKRKLILLNLECEDLKSEKLRLQQELEGFKKASSMKSRELEHKINKLHYENLNLKDTIEKNTGTFRFKDDVVAELIGQYKMNEEVYNDTIRQLQENNQGLIAEILNLKEEVLIALYDKGK